jgi:hypothetical protein
MFTKMCNLRSSGYPLMNVTKDGVDGVISLNCLVDSWVWRSLTLNLLIIFLVFIIESRLEGGGVNRAKLKFTKLRERGRKTNRKQIKSVTRGFVLPGFGSRKPTPR